MQNYKLGIIVLASLVPLILTPGGSPKSDDNAPKNNQPGLLEDMASAPFPLPVIRVMDLLARQIKYIAERERMIIAFGRGDHEIALQGLQRLADGDDGIAQLYVGVIYDRGHGVPQDHVKAVTWYRKAAEQGVVEAQNNLGVHYTNGHGVPREYLQAYKWFYLAAARGNVHASRNRQLLAQRMSAGQISEARQLALNWIEEHGNDPRYQSSPGDDR